jgi:hypothetical protein
VFDASSSALLTALSPEYHAWFTQADYVIYPWLQASARYEMLTPADPEVPNLKTGVVNLSALVRANVKAMVEYQCDLRETANHSLIAQIRFGF